MKSQTVSVLKAACEEETKTPTRGTVNLWKQDGVGLCGRKDQQLSLVSSELFAFSPLPSSDIRLSPASAEGASEVCEVLTLNILHITDLGGGWWIFPCL